MLHLLDRPRARVFIRRDRFNRFVTALAYIPKDRFNSDLRERVGEAIAARLWRQGRKLLSRSWAKASLRASCS